MTYELGYPGTNQMQGHDAHGELHRWFHNWKSNQNSSFYGDYEYLLVETVRFTTARGRERVRYVGNVGEEGGLPRRIEFDHTAPPPPSFYARAKFTRLAPRLRAAHYPNMTDVMQSLSTTWSRGLMLDREQQFMLARMESYKYRHSHRIAAEAEAPKVTAIPLPPRYRRNV